MTQRGVYIDHPRLVYDIHYIAKVDATARHDGNTVAKAQLHFGQHRDAFLGSGLATRSEHFVETQFNDLLHGLKRLHASINGPMESEFHPLSRFHQSFKGVHIRHSFIIQGTYHHPFKTKLFAKHDVGFHEVDFFLIIDVIARTGTNEHPHGDEGDIDGFGERSERGRQASHLKGLTEFNTLGATLHGIAQAFDAIGTDFKTDHNK